MKREEALAKAKAVGTKFTETMEKTYTTSEIILKAMELAEFKLLVSNDFDGYGHRKAAKEEVDRWENMYLEHTYSNNNEKDEIPDAEIIDFPGCKDGRKVS